MIRLMNTKKAEGQIFNIGNDKEITIEALAQKIKKMAGSNSKIEFIKYEDAYEEGFEDMRHRKPDLTKIKEYIDYKPKYNLDQILERIITYFEQ